MEFLKQIHKFFVKLTRRDEGAMATEFALTLPIYLASIIFLVEVSRIAYTKSVVIHAAEEATRYALVNYGATVDEIQENAREGLVGLTPTNLRAIVVTNPVDPTDMTRLVTVEIRYRYAPILPVGAFLGGDARGFDILGESKGFITEEIPAL